MNREEIAKKGPCEPDHNGECLSCDAWLSDCEWKKMWLDNHYHYSLNEQIELFMDRGVLSQEQKDWLIANTKHPLDYEERTERHSSHKKAIKIIYVQNKDISETNE